jgi:hypothetical protein
MFHIRKSPNSAPACCISGAGGRTASPFSSFPLSCRFYLSERASHALGPFAPSVVATLSSPEPGHDASKWKKVYTNGLLGEPSCWISNSI